MKAGRDAIAMDSPAAEAELKLLQAMKVGDTREGVLLPALAVGIVWTLILKTADRWEFDGAFFGQPLYRLVIRNQGGKLTLDVETV